MKKKIILYAGIVVGLLLLSYAYVPQVLSGKIVNQSDISGWQGMSREMMTWNAAHPDDQTAWTESMFGGMPTATIHASTRGDWTQKIYDFLLLGRRPATYLFISLLGAWLLMLALGIQPLVAVGGAIAVTFCAYNLQIIQVGHNTKMQALAFLPWVLAALIFTYKQALGKAGPGKKQWLPGTILGAALFGLTMSFQVKANHPQITYYLALLILIYVIVLVVSIWKERKWGRFFAASALLLVLGVAGIATNATKLLPTMEYTPYSMRGGSTAASEGGEGAKGLDLDYATAWSYGWEELPNLLIPNFNGGSSSGAVNPKHSATYDLLKQAGQPNLREISKHLPLYWGPQPFTAGPMYMGAITLFLFVLGLYLYKGKEIWWLVAGTILAVFLALGSHFLAFTKFFYDVVPLYNKFRTVSMALTVLQFTLPMLAFLVLDRLVRDPEAAELFRRKGWIAAAITGGFCLLCALFPDIAGSFTGSVDDGQPEILIDALAEDRRHLLAVDALRSLLFIGGAFALLWWGASRRRTLPAALLVSLLVLLDLGLAGKRYLSDSDFVSPRAFQSQFEQRIADKEILKDTDPSYRVLDLSVNIFNDSHPSYWHKNIGGYSPAKLQRYQEFIESTLTGEINQLIKAMNSTETILDAENALEELYLPGLASLNCRYIILDGELPPLRYPHAKGNAWFADSGAGVRKPSPSSGGVPPEPPASQGSEPLVAAAQSTSVELTSYAPNELRYEYTSPEAARMVFSEVYYPVGWTLKVEDTGEELPIELEGTLLRAAQVPAGEHTLVMRFDPPSYRTGAAVSRATSILLILAVLGALAIQFSRKRDEVVDA